MSSIVCPHCAQTFENYNNGVTASKCPKCGGEIGYAEGDTIIKKNHFPKLVKYSIIVFPITALIGGIVEGNEWYETLGMMFAGPIVGIIAFYFLTHYKGSVPYKK